MIAGKEKLDVLAEVALEQIDEDMPEGTIVGAAMFIVEVRNRGEDLTSIYTFSTDKREWVQRALVREALDVVENDLAVIYPEDEPDAD